MADTAGRTPEDFVGDQIVVATPHVGIVRHILAGLDVGSREIDDSPELGLTLLELPVADVAAAASRDSRPDAPGNELSRVLGLAYREAEKQYDQWTPVMGKNRYVHPIIGMHNIGGGGACAPVKSAFAAPPRDGQPGTRVRVGVADTSLAAHPWLAGAYDAAPSSMWADNPVEAVSGHATFVAGLILQRAPGATLDVRRVLGPDGQADSWDVAKELVRFARSGLDVLNLSFGCLTDDHKPPLVLSTALDRLDPRTVVVAAAGNHGDSPDKGRPVWPAAFEEVVAVTAVDDDGRVPAWSTALDVPWVDVAARGTSVVSTFLSGRYDLGEGQVEEFDGGASWSGTSFATASVTGAIAARVLPGEVGASAALADVMRRAEQLPRRLPGRTIRWVR